MRAPAVCSPESVRIAQPSPRCSTRLDDFRCELRAGVESLALECRAELEPGDRIGEPGKVLHATDAEQLAAGEPLAEAERSPTETCREQRGRRARHAGADDHDVVSHHPTSAIAFTVTVHSSTDGVQSSAVTTLPESMLAAVLPAPGEALQIEEIPVPRPRRGEVLVRVAACGVCHTDLHVIKGEVAFPTPAVLGHEISGTVVVLGAGVDAPASATTGRRHVHHAVRHMSLPASGPETTSASGSLRSTDCEGRSTTARPASTGADGTPLAMYSMGGLAEYCVIPATGVFPLPDGVDARAVCDPRLRGDDGVRRGPARRPSCASASASPWSGIGGVGSMVVSFARALGRLAGRRRRHQRGEARGGARAWAPPMSSTRSKTDPVEAVADADATAASTSPSRSWGASRHSCRRSGCSATAGGWSPSESRRPV